METTTNDNLIRWYERQYGPFVHMSQLDKAIWLRYLMAGGSQFAPFIYDLRVGDGVKMPTGSTDFDIRAALALTTKRIDAIAFHANRVRIYEVKQRAGLSAIGQLVGYKTLHDLAFPSSSVSEMWLITDRLQPDMTTPLITAGINYVEVGE